MLGGSPRPWPNMQAPLPPHVLPSSLPSSVPLLHGSGAEEVAGDAVQPLADAGDELAPAEEPAFNHIEAVPEDAEALHGFGDPGELEWSANGTIEAALFSLDLTDLGQDQTEQPSAPELGKVPDSDLT